MRLIPVLIYLLILCPAFLKAQTLTYSQYSIKDGLAGNQVYSICQDQQGFLWFGTETGVSRFDGSKFKNFTIKDGLPDNAIIKVFTDSRGRVWLIPFNKSICYYYKGKIYNQQNDSLLRSINFKNPVLKIRETESGSLLFFSFQDLLELKPNGRLNWISVLPSHFFDSRITELTPPEEFIIMDSIFTFRNGQISFLKKTSPTAISFRYVYNDLEIWLEDNSNTLIINSEKRKLHYSIPFPIINTITQINDSLFSINTVKGALLLNVCTGKIIRHLMPDMNIASYFMDNESNIWLTTLPGGLLRIHSEQFRCITSDPSGKPLSVTSFFKKKNGLIIGADKKVFELDANLKLSPVALPPSIDREVTHIDQRNGKFYISAGHLLFVGTPQLGFAEYNLFGSIKEFAFNKENNPIAVTSSGVYLVPKIKPKQYPPIYKGRTTTIVIHNDTCWFGTVHGLYRLGHDLVSHWLGDLTPELQDRITAIEVDKYGQFWVATAGKGVVAMKNNRIVYRINSNHGLSSDAVHCIEPDDDGSIWLGTDKGVDHITFSGGQPNVSNRLYADGIVSGFVNAVASKGDTIFAGTPEGIFLFNKKAVPINSQCKLILQEVISAGKSVESAGIPDMKYGAGNLTIRYTAISFKSAGHITYHYRLKGLDTVWKQTELQSLEFISLPPGEYELELFATNKFNVNSDTIHLHWTVYPRFWQKGWFLLLVLLAAILLTRYLVKRKNRIEHNKKEQERSTKLRIQQLEQKAMLAQMNPHFIFNSMHAVQEFILDKDILSANRYLNSFARLIRQTLDQSMRPYLSLSEEIEYLTTYFKLEQLRFSHQFDYEFIIQESVNPEEIFIPCLLLQPIIENAIGHGIQHRIQKAGGRVVVEFSIEGNQLICSVRDNGLGFEAVQALKTDQHIEHQSRGMQLTRDRIALLGKSLSAPAGLLIKDIIKNNAVEGTEIILQLPLITTPNIIPA
ncbi:histidine kinase [Pseudoflavitalea sp. G-6-1-2]|uniref:ligand-binding sensor domain-containing protein n=1 Tax=Pseudoflavitalea sp. G-6-1-2 TaxID=2728841 RepID=UPI00146C9A5F|nr:sensor histidine kinase [Pseudoflavitalea sp. G-6-1-2]NML23980.1 histidine kinase [Pseudoflavitalea sp. G-6-1-2]